MAQPGAAAAGAAAGAGDPLAWVPSVDIDVEDPSVQRYQEVIDFLMGRDLARAGADPKNRFRDIPITSRAAEWRRINLVHAGRPTVSLLIDEVDCYLVAINPGDGRGWLKLDDRHVPEDVQTTSMGLESSYTVLRAGIDKTDMVFGLQILNHGHHTLSTFDPNLGMHHPKMKRQRKVLVQMAVMFCEVIRFKVVLQMILNMMTDNMTGTLGLNEWDWIQNWSTISKFALACKSLEDRLVFADEARDLEKVATHGIGSREDAVRILGLILRSAIAVDV